MRSLREYLIRIAVEIWKRLAQKLPNGKLHRIRLYETPDLYVDYFGEA